MPKQTTFHFSHHDPERPSGYSLREISTLSKSSLVMMGKNIKKSRNVIILVDSVALTFCVSLPSFSEVCGENCLAVPGLGFVPSDTD